MPPVCAPMCTAVCTVQGASDVPNATCVPRRRDPFSRMHPDGAVTNLAAAMDPKYDSLYGAFQKLQYTQCGM